MKFWLPKWLRFGENRDPEPERRGTYAVYVGDPSVRAERRRQRKHRRLMTRRAMRNG